MIEFKPSQSPWRSLSMCYSYFFQLLGHLTCIYLFIAHGFKFSLSFGFSPKFITEMALKTELMLPDYEAGL